MLTLNQEFQHKFSVTQTNVEQFAQLTGDNNPIHLDEEYASSTPFKKPIVHGMWGASVFSKVLGTLFPGEGSIYLSQTLSFRRPMFVGEPYEAIFTVVEINTSKHKAKIRTQIIHATTRKSILEGEAEVMNKQFICENN